MRKNVCVGLVGPAPPPFGGMANQTRQLSELLRSEGVVVEFVQTNAPYGFRVVERIKGLRAFFRLIPYLWKIWWLVGQVDVVHLMANSGWSWQLFAAPVVWIGWVRNTPVVVNYRGGEAAEYFSKSIGKVRPTMMKASVVVVPSDYLREVFANFDLTALTIANIIDLDRFGPRKREGISDPRKPHLIVTRNLETIYGIDTAIKAVALLSKTIPGIKLSIAGSGPQDQQLKKLVETLQLADVVKFTGKLDPQRMAQLYQSADIMLNPTTVDNMPNSLLEAMASRVAIVTTNVGGIPYIVEHNKNALLVDAGNEKKMAEQAKRLIDDEDLYRKITGNGLSDVQQYTWSVVGRQWLDLYADLAGHNCSEISRH